jgi:sugar lactone lactonase YvrE
MFPSEAVATSIAIGPDGAYYVGELKGFPAPTGESRVWRIEPGTRHAECGTSPACSVVADGFTSIVDLAFGPDGTLYVVELDEATWAAVEFGLGSLGGTVNACDVASGSCSEVAAGLPIPMAAAVDRDGVVYTAILALVPGSAQVIALP